MRRLVLAVLSLAFLGACQPATTELTEEQKAEIVEAVKQTYLGVAQTVNEVNQDAWLGYFLNAEEFTYVANGGISRSYAAFVDTVDAHWAPFSEMTFAWGDLIVDVLAPTVALVTTTFDFSGTDSVGEVYGVAGTWTGVSVLHDGEWKIVNVAETFPPAETSPETA